MATFGNTTIESGDASFANTIRLLRTELPENGSITKISAYLEITTSAKNVVAGVYDVDDNLEGSVVVNCGVGTGWVDFTFAPPYFQYSWRKEVGT